jgi:hypothetical protein
VSGFCRHPSPFPFALDELVHHGLDGLALQATKQLHISSAEDWYGDGAFDVDRKIRRLMLYPTELRAHVQKSRALSVGERPTSRNSALPVTLD